jgi:hypothetical protein
MERARARVLVLAISVAAQLLTVGHRWGAPDEVARVQSAQRLLDAGTLRLPDGRHSKYPPLTSILLVPGVLLKRAVPGGDDVLLMVPSVLAGAACVVPFQRALWAVGVPMGASVVAGAVYALANPVWPYTKRLYSEPFTALFVLCAVAAALSYRVRKRWRSLAYAWLCMAGAAGNNSVSLVLLPVVAGLLAFPPAGGGDKRVVVDRRGLASSVVGGAALVAAWLLINHLKFGSPFSTGYQDGTVPNDVFTGESGFSTPAWIGLYGLLLSAGRGLLFYCPVCLVGAWALWRFKHRWLGAAPWLLLGGLLPLLAYAKWWSWHGGTCFGPRLLTPFVGVWALGVGPLLVELNAGRLRGMAVRLVLAGSAAASVFAAAVGTLFMFSYDQQFWLRDKPFNDFLDVYTPQYSAIPRSLVNLVLFPDDVNWMWLHAAPRRPLEVRVPGGTRVVEVSLKAQALRDNWEVAEVVGFTASGREVHPAWVKARDGHRPESMADGDLATSWLGGTQKAGQWALVAFTEEVRRVVFHHGREGAAYPKFPAVRAGAVEDRLGRPWDVATTRGDLSLRWPGWLCLLVLLASSLGVWRMAKVPVERKTAPGVG